jgi:hypothetical protein
MRIQPKARLMAWRLEPLEIWNKSNPRGFELFYKKVRIARVVPFRVGFVQFSGWYWLAEHEGDNEIPTIPKKDTSDKPIDDPKKAREACEDYVRKCLGKPKHGPRRWLTWVKDTSDPRRSTTLSPPCGGKFVLNDKVVVGEIKPLRIGFGEYHGWYWIAFPTKLPEEFSHLTVSAFSSKSYPVPELNAARSECDAYLRKQLLVSPTRHTRRKNKQ